MSVLPRLIGFLLTGLIFHTVLYTVYVGLVRDGHKAVRSDRAFVLKAPKQIDVLVVGDSHPRTAVDPRLMGEGVVNVAIGGEHYLKTLYRMRMLIERSNRKVDAILIPLDAGSFSGWHAENFAPEYVWGRYVDFLEVGRARGRPFGYIGRLLKAKVAPYAGELRTINQLRTKRFGFGEDLPTGQYSAFTVAERRSGALLQAQQHFKGVELVDPGLLWAFQQIVAWADAENIKVVAVAYPLTHWYDRWVDFTGVRERVQAEVITPFVADPDHIFLDYHDLFGQRDEFFSDPHHLNIAGRTAFSKRLRADLVERQVLTP